MHAGLTLIAISLITIVNARALDEDMLLYWRKSDAGKCKPFTSFFMGCNKCVCSADGTSFCTRMACFKATNRLSEESIENEMDTLKQPSVEKLGATSHQKEKGNSV
ncbi:uncharacterized protein LOC111354562 [Spodoptera litura]|uniref:Uncharacterized protein LOC111354562 n=1 Tax=Spodoptera litura TaxID=69820 RepID=A0A9J7EA37_SPOLT|nr:uncharacterized protein LOC111354562 [Spodoptera litura]